MSDSEDDNHEEIDDTLTSEVKEQSEFENKNHEEIDDILTSEIKEQSDSEDDNHEEIDDILTSEEKEKIETIQMATFAPQAIKEEPKPVPSIWSLLVSVINGRVNPYQVAATIGTQSAVPKFELAKFLYLDKSVIINNISGKNAYIILSSNPIKTVNAVAVNAGAGGVEAGIDIKFEDKGHYEVQKISISNNTSSRCRLDNTQIRCTLYFDIDGIWKRTWENRRFDARKYNINILEKHVDAALEKGNIPDF